MYWPTEEGISLVADQITVTLLKQESLEEGMLNMMEFELAVSEEVSYVIYSAVPFLQIPHNMGCLLWIQMSIYVMPH